LSIELKDYIIYLKVYLKALVLISGTVNIIVNYLYF